MIPLAIEAQLLALTGFAVGMIGAYIAELRRRANRWNSAGEQGPRCCGPSQAGRCCCWRTKRGR